MLAGIIASGLTANDPTFSGSPYKINETRTMTFAGASRTVNHFRPDTFNSSVEYAELWWDKDTGLLVKMLWWYAPMNWWENLTMMSTTAWTPSVAPAASAFSTTTIMIIGGVGVIALAVGYVIGRGGKRKK